jgi:soluble epoxide hydrolase/lipid-phosphate phosphatase
MLGCGCTDKPIEESEYTPRKICADLASLLDLLAVEKTVRALFRPMRIN